MVTLPTYNQEYIIRKDSKCELTPSRLIAFSFTVALQSHIPTTICASLNIIIQL